MLSYCSSVTRMPDFGLDNGRGGSHPSPLPNGVPAMARLVYALVLLQQLWVPRTWRADFSSRMSLWCWSALFLGFVFRFHKANDANCQRSLQALNTSSGQLLFCSVFQGQKSAQFDQYLQDGHHSSTCPGVRWVLVLFSSLPGVDVHREDRPRAPKCH